MPAFVKCQPGPSGEKQFVFCTSETAGHGDLIGGIEEFDQFLLRAIGLAQEHGTSVGVSLEIGLGRSVQHVSTPTLLEAIVQTTPHRLL